MRSATAPGPSTLSSTATSSSGSAGDSNTTFANNEVTLRTSASSSRSCAGDCSSMGSIRALRYGSVCTISTRRNRPTPWAMSRREPSGCLSALWITVNVPTEWRPSAPGASSFGSFCVTAPTRRPPCTASSIRRSDDTRPAPSGTTACGKSTVPRSGRIPTTSGIGRSVSRFMSVIVNPLSQKRSTGPSWPDAARTSASRGSPSRSARVSPPPLSRT